MIENLKKESKQKIIISSLLVFLLVIQFAFLSYLFKSLVPEDEKKEQNVVMSYTSKGDFDYKVYLKPNEFIKEEYLGENESYVTDLIDHININYLYNFSSTEKTKVNGKSKFNVKLKVNYGSNNGIGANTDASELLKKEKILSEKTIEFNDNKYTNIETLDLYLKEYMDILDRFQSEVKISVNGYLEITADTNFKGLIGGATYNDSYSNTLRIPLGQSVIKIDETNSKAKTNKVYAGDLVKTNKVVLSYIVIANLVTFALICLLLRKLFMFTNKSCYQREIDKILRNYDDIIVNVMTNLDISNYKLVEINEFKELLNLSRELLLPIMNYEVIKGDETWFYVLKDNIFYRYIISNDKLEEEKIEKEKKSIFKRKDN